MTILHILDHSVPLVSGYSFRSRNLVRFQQQVGLRPVVLTSPRQGSERDGTDTLEGIRHYRTGPVGGRLPWLREVRQMGRMAMRIAAVARSECASCLHAHSPLLNGLPALWAGRRLGLPVVYEARAFWEDAAVDHGTVRQGSLRYRLTRLVETWLFRKADRVVTICEGMRKEIMRRGVDAARIAVVPNGVDVDVFRPRSRSESLVKRIGLNGGPVFGFIGSFYRYEGLRFLIDSIPAIREALVGTRVLLVGGGEEDAALRTAAARLGDTVVFVGQVPHQRVGEFLSVMDVFVCPRRRIRLTELVTPLKPLEAMAMGRPVLASDVGGHRELIRHEATGLLFPAESQRAFVAQATRIGADPLLRKALGETARSYVLGERSWDRVVPMYVRIYSELA